MAMKWSEEAWSRVAVDPIDSMSPPSSINRNEIQISDSGGGNNGDLKVLYALNAAKFAIDTVLSFVEKGGKNAPRALDRNDVTEAQNKMNTAVIEITKWLSK